MNRNNESCSNTIVKDPNIGEIVYDLNTIKWHEFETLVDKRLEEWKKNGQPSGQELAALIEISDDSSDNSE